MASGRLSGRGMNRVGAVDTVERLSSPITKWDLSWILKCRSGFLFVMEIFFFL